MICLFLTQGTGYARAKYLGYHCIRVLQNRTRMDLQTEDKVRENCRLGHKVPPAMTEVNKCPQTTKRIQLPMVNFIIIFIVKYPT